MSIKRILIPTDFSETAELALSHGVYMANLFTAKIFLLHMEESKVYAGITVEPVLLYETEPPMRQRNRNYTAWQAI
jgi:Universal stress protein family